MGPEVLQAVVEQSCVRGAARLALTLIAMRAEVCIGSASLYQIMRFSGYSRTHVLRAIRELRESRTAVWIDGEEGFTDDGARRYHLPRACDLGSYCEKMTALQPNEFTGGCEAKPPAASVRGRGTPPAALPEEKTNAEGCLLCRGTRWKLVPRPDGTAGNVVIRCRRHVTQLQLVEVPAVSWAPVISEEQLWWRSKQLRGARPDGFRLEP